MIRTIEKITERNGTNKNISVTSFNNKLSSKNTAVKIKYFIEVFSITKKVKKKYQMRKKGNTLSINKYDDHSLNVKELSRNKDASNPTHLLKNFLPMKKTLIIFNKKKNLVTQKAFFIEMPKSQKDDARKMENKGLRSKTFGSIWFIG